MKMYNYNQDICLLHYSLVSAANTLQFSGKFTNSDSYKDGIDIVSDTVKKILYLNLFDIKDEKEIIKKELYINERLHAAVLFNTLGSYNMKNADATKYYSSVSFGWPAMDFKFYIELNYSNKWSEYFIRCALQLPSQVLYTVLKEILSLHLSKPVKYYSWHLVLQVVILKLFEINLVHNTECSFAFNFTNVEGFVNKSEDVLSLFEELCDTLYSSLSEELKQSNDIELIKIVLHATKTLLKYCKDNKCIKCNNLFELLNDCLQISTNIEVLEMAISNCSDSFASVLYSTASWNISECYLILILNSYLSKKNMYEKNYSTSESNPDWTENNRKRFFKVHQTLKEVFMKCFDINNEKHLELLLKIVQHNFEGVSFALEVLLSNPSVFEKDDHVQILEEGNHSIDIKMYPLLLKSVVMNKSQDMKIRLLKVFYEVLSNSPVNNYNAILLHILEVYTFTDEFQLPDFENQLSLAVQETLTLSEAEKIVPPFILQSPVVTLKYIIEQFFLQGEKAKSLIQILEFIPIACTYTERNEDMPPLIEILNYYFKKALEPYEVERMTILLELLMEVQSKKSILCVNLFLEKCILPFIDCDDKSLLVLLCLAKSLKILIANGVFDVGLNTLKNVISSLAHLVHNCVESGNGEIKEQAIKSLLLLEDYQKQSKTVKDVAKIQIGLIVYPLNEAVQVYTAEFLPSDPVLLCQSSQWILFCKNKDFSSFEDQFHNKALSYLEVINILHQVLPHCTKDEWGNYITLVKICCENSNLRKQILQSSNCPFTLSDKEADLYAVISCFISSLHIILSEGTIEQPMYMISCFSNCLMKLLSEDEALKSQIFLAVFLDISFLIHRISTHVSDAIISIFGNLLVDLRNSTLTSCADNVNFKKACEKFMCFAAKCIHNSSTNSTLLQVISN